MAQTVYVVSCGEYSDYGVFDVFTTREKAEEWIKHNTDPVTGKGAEWYPYTIEERTLDPDSVQRVWADCWTAQLVLETGNRLLDYDGNPVKARHNREEITEGRRAAGAQIGEIWQIGMVGRCGHGVLGVTATSYVSEDHAWKLAAEARQKWLRERAVNTSA